MGLRVRNPSGGEKRGVICGDSQLGCWRTSPAHSWSLHRSRRNSGSLVFCLHFGFSSTSLLLDLVTSHLLPITTHHCSVDVNPHWASCLEPTWLGDNPS